MLLRECVADDSSKITFNFSSTYVVAFFVLANNVDELVGPFRIVFNATAN